MKTTELHSFAGISPGASVLPFALFVTTVIGLSFFWFVDINLLIVVGIVAVVGGSLLATDTQQYWTTVFAFFGSRTAVTASLLWLLVGVYGNILKEGHIVEGLVWAAATLDFGGTAFIIVTFLFSGLFAISTGSGFGTISAMSLTLFPAGIAVGGDAALLGGAILSGAALGDSISPVSDTAVIAATTQQDKDGSVTDVGGSVRHRLPVVLWAVVLTVLLFSLAGMWSPETLLTDITTNPDDYKSLFLLFPTLAVMILAFYKVNIFVSLFVGIVMAVSIGLGLHLFTPANLVNTEGGHVGGAVVEGIGSMANICLLLMVVVSLSGLIIRSGCCLPVGQSGSLRHCYWPAAWYQWVVGRGNHAPYWLDCLAWNGTNRRCYRRCDASKIAFFQRNTKCVVCECRECGIVTEGESPYLCIRH